MYRKLAFIACSLALLGGSGCSYLVYKIDIRQGNNIDQATISRLYPGMTKQQVESVLGSPLLTDPFHEDRWDYYYSFSERGGPAEQKHVALYFQGELLARVEGSATPVTVPR
jgi:outer membrane protein assembly factor BamE